MMLLLLDAVIIILFAIGVGTIASMLGIGGGILNTPLLIIVFGLSALIAPASSLFAALFCAISSTISYSRQQPRPIIVKPGLFLALTTIPGSLTGVFLRSLIADDYLLRLLFGILFFPLAIKMLFAKGRESSDFVSELSNFNFPDISNRRLVYSLLGAFAGGVLAGLLGIGGGIIVVPIFTLLMGLPMHAAVATSMFTMIFTTMAGTTLDLIMGQIDLFFSIALSIGMVIGALIGPHIARRINAVILKQLFGLVLVFPLVKLMRLGQIWLDPVGVNFLLATIGDVIIWFLIIVPIGILRFAHEYRAKKQRHRGALNCEEDFLKNP